MRLPSLPEILAAAQGRFSLQFVVLVSLLFFWIVVGLSAYMLAFRTYHRLRERYRARRRSLYGKAIEAALMEEPLDAVTEALRPRRPGDADIVMEVLVEGMRHLKGPPFELLREAAFRLGLIERELKALRAWSKHRRGRAMEALGLTRSPQAIVGVLDTLDQEPLDMRLVALRTLAAIGDPIVLPYFVKAAGKLPPPMMSRLASLMLEFGPAARPAIAALVRASPQAFPPRVLKELLAEVAAELEPP